MATKKTKTVQTISIKELKDKIDASGKFRTQVKGNSLILYRDYSKRQIGVTLKKMESGKFLFESDYNFISRISHLTYQCNGGGERRLNRNKVIIFSIANKLIACDVWQYVDVDASFMINPDNRNLTRRKRGQLEGQIDRLKKLKNVTLSS